jgi:hypothetical protein
VLVEVLERASGTRTDISIRTSRALMIRFWIWR